MSIMAEKTKRNCPDCAVKPGELHDPGCDVERCALCGGQAIGYDCIYEVLGLSREEVDDLRDSPEGDAVFARLDAAVAAVGGRLPWTGVWPGDVEAAEFGFWCRWVDGKGWVSCEATHPDATEDLNRLATEARWDAAARRWTRAEAAS